MERVEKARRCSCTIYGSAADPWVRTTKTRSRLSAVEEELAATRNSNRPSRGVTELTRVCDWRWERDRRLP